jgi:uncharacterized protein YkwD
MRFLVVCLLTGLLGFTSGLFLAVPLFSSGIVVTPTEPETYAQPQETCLEGTWPDCTATSTTATTTETTAPTKPANQQLPSFALPIEFNISDAKIFADGLTITLTTINDSRCAPSVQCIWAGELAPQLQLSGGDLGTGVSQVSFGSVTATTVHQGVYTIELITATTNGAVLKVTKDAASVAIPTATVPQTPVLPSEDVEPNKQPVTQQSEADFAKEINSLLIEATNKFRRGQSLTPFVTDVTLIASAKKFSSQLLIGKYLAHIDTAGCNLTCRFTASGYLAQSWGENLAMINFTDKSTATYVANFFMAEWLSSSGHRKNILSPTFTHQGIGVSVDGNNVYSVVHFALTKVSSQ